MSQVLFKTGKNYRVTMEGQATNGNKLSIKTGETGIFDGKRAHIFATYDAEVLSDAYTIEMLPDDPPGEPATDTLFLVKWNGSRSDTDRWYSDDWSCSLESQCFLSDAHHVD